MPYTTVNGLLAAATAPLNLLFVGLQLLFFTLALRKMKDRSRAAQEFVKTAPERLTGLGILGTFTGICVGLLKFDVDAIDKTLPALLSGLTTAFIASVVGLSLALILRTIHDSYRKANPQVTPGVSVRDLHAELAAIREVLLSTAREHSDGLAAIRGAVSGDEAGTLTSHMRMLQESVGGGGDNTLVSQVRLLRQDSNDAARESGRRFDEFAKQVSEIGSKALVEALRDVIRDFNQNLTQQFGDNFRELNLAVHELVEWQNRYRGQIEELGNRFADCLAGIERSRDSIASIATSSEAIPAAMDKLSQLLGALQQQQTVLDNQLQAYSELGRQAVQAMPTIEENISRLTDGFTQTILASIQRLETAESSQQAALDRMGKAYEQLRLGIEQSVANHDEHVKVLLETLTRAHAGLDSQLKEMQQKAFTSWRESFDRSAKETNELMTNQTQKLGEALGTQVQSTVGDLSQHLLGLHERLVADYTPLTERLRSIVELSRRTDR